MIDFGISGRKSLICEAPAGLDMVVQKHWLYVE